MIPSLLYAAGRGTKVPFPVFLSDIAIYSFFRICLSRNPDVWRAKRPSHYCKAEVPTYQNSAMMVQQISDAGSCALRKNL